MSVAGCDDAGNTASNQTAAPAADVTPKGQPTTLPDKMIGKWKPTQATLDGLMEPVPDENRLEISSKEVAYYVANDSADRLLVSAWYRTPDGAYVGRAEYQRSNRKLPSETDVWLRTDDGLIYFYYTSPGTEPQWRDDLTFIWNAGDGGWIEADSRP